MAYFTLASPAAMAGTQPVNSGNIDSTVTVVDTISMTGVGNSVPFGQGSPGDNLSVPNAITPVITVLHHGGGTLSEIPVNGAFHYSLGGPEVIPETDVSINGTPLKNGNPTPLQVINSGTNAQSFPETWSLAIPTTPESAYDGSSQLFADFSLQLVAN